MHEHKERPISLSNVPKWKVWTTLSFLLAAIVLAFTAADISIIAAAEGIPAFFKFFAENFLPPNFAVVRSYIPLIFQTVLFAVMGTYISAFLAFVFGLLLSPKTNPIRWLRTVVLFFMSFLRNVPFLVWAALLVYIFGIGNMVGLISLIFATLGFLSRSYAESLNEIADAKLEALKSCGASYMQILFHGVIPAFIPSWLNWTLFSFEINIRASVILGMVGAGGIGIMIQTNIRLFKYREAFALIIVLIVMIVLTELGTSKLRRHIA